MKNARIIREIIDNNVITKLETMPVGASIARPHSRRIDLRPNQNGITLIALIITIIILLILASITINLTLGERGIFNTAKKAVENYKDAEEKELANLNDFEQEAGNAINEIGNGSNNTKPEEQPKPVLLNTVTSANYGDYVNYPVSIGRGPEGIAQTHKTDWRIFYNDGTYVYLIASYLLLNSEVPSGTGMSSYSGKPYGTYWENEPNYTIITDMVRTNYKMSWNQNTTNINIKCVSTLLNTNLWNKFVFNTANGYDKNLAEDAIGAPTLEMWLESWNSKENTKLYCNNNNNNGYYLGTTSTPTTTSVSGLSTNNSLYFPITSWNESTGGYYWLSSPTAYISNYLMCVRWDGILHYPNYNDSNISLRPLIRLKPNIMGIKDENEVWQLQ